MKRTILFVAYSSNKLGYGHLSRCLSLISRAPKNVRSILLTNKNKILDEKLKNSNAEILYKVNEYLLTLSIDIVLYDSSRSDNILLEKLYKSFNSPIYALDNFDYSSFYIDGYINLFDQKPKKLKPKNKVIKQGLKYAIISDKILAFKAINKNHSKIKNIMILFGGADINNFTEKILVFLDSIDFQYNIDVVLGPLNNNFKRINELSESLKCKVTIVHNPDNLVEIMSKQDLCFSGCATTFFELSFLGIPSIVSYQNKDEEYFAQYLFKQGLVQNVNLSLKNRWDEMQNRIIYNKFKQKQLTVFTGDGISNIYSILGI